MSNPTPSRYQWSYQGVSFDFYRLCEILGITHHAQAHALKKVIRAGQSVKPLVQDIDESIACLQRWREMVVEDEGEIIEGKQEMRPGLWWVCSACFAPPGHVQVGRSIPSGVCGICEKTAEVFPYRGIPN